MIAVGIVARAAAADEAVNEPAKETATPEQVGEWLAQLDDDRYLERERATQKLIEAGEAALDPLLAIANGKRLEPADRAVWILQRQSKAADNAAAIAALERIVQLENRPSLVEKADRELAERSVRACHERLAPLGAELAIEMRQYDVLNVVPVLVVRLDETWRGTAEDLRCLSQLRRQQYFHLEGKAVDDAVAKFFEEKEKLQFVQFWNTRVTPAAIDSLKSRHPEANVYVRGQALLGVVAVREKHPSGVLVQNVEPGTAAFAAGIVAGDVITSIGGNSIPDFDRLTAHIAQRTPGETVPVEILRGGERKKLAVTLGSWTGQER
jgi:hypothetical protein